MFAKLKQGMAKERPISSVPKGIIFLLIISFFSQITWHALRPPPVAHVSAVPLPPRIDFLKLISLGEPEALARVLMLWLQAFDNQPGVSIPFKQLDYDCVIAWLDTILRLDPGGQYPLLSAARVYSEVPDEKKVRTMLAFVRDRFLERPNERWMWLAHAAYVAKHRIKDLNLALSYARALRMHATATTVPSWAKQMELFVLEDQGAVEEAKILLGGLIESGVIKDDHEIRFLTQRLENAGDDAR